jgi:CHAT domain-containing protein
LYNGGVENTGRILRVGNVDRIHIEYAIESQDKALQYEQEKVKVLQNQEHLSNVWIERSSCFQHIQDYDKAINSCREGLAHVERVVEPKGWANLNDYLGTLYYLQAQWMKAANSFKNALQVFTSEHFPYKYLDSLEMLVECLYRLGVTNEAQILEQDGSDLLRRLLSQLNVSPVRERFLRSKQATFNQLSVDLTVQSGDSVKAMELAEHGKNTFLRWMLGFNEPPFVSYSQIQSWLPSTTAIIYWHLSPIALTTFLILPGHDRPLLISTIDNTESDERPVTLKQLTAWETWIDEWNEDYQLYSVQKNSIQSNHPWRDRMIERFKQLQQILNISSIKDQLPPSITQLILVPHRDLHRLPLHAFFNLPSTYLPSIYLGLSNESNANIHNRLLLIENPKNEDVREGGGTFIEIESALIQSLFPTQVIESENATAEQVKSSLAQPHRLLHFSGHGSYNSSNPAQSCLYLSGRDQLTLQTLAHLDLSAYKLICLAACETGVTGRQTITDEYVGLPSAFLKDKATHVVSTFWRVESAASAFLIVEFYRSLQAGNPPEIALQHAQNFLKTASCKDLIYWIDTISAHLPKSCQIALRDKRQQFVEDPIARPYKHPYYWAAFSISGLGETRNNKSASLRSARYTIEQ